MYSTFLITQLAKSHQHELLAAAEKRRRYRAPLGEREMPCWLRMLLQWWKAWLLSRSTRRHHLADRFITSRWQDDVALILERAQVSSHDIR